MEYTSKEAGVNSETWTHDFQGHNLKLLPTELYPPSSFLQYNYIINFLKSQWSIRLDLNQRYMRRLQLHLLNHLSTNA